MLGAILGAKSGAMLDTILGAVLDMKNGCVHFTSFECIFGVVSAILQPVQAVWLKDLVLLKFNESSILAYANNIRQIWLIQYKYQFEYPTLSSPATQEESNVI